MHLSMFSPGGGGGGGGADVGHLIKLVQSPESGEFDWKVRPHGRAI